MINKKKWLVKCKVDTEAEAFVVVETNTEHKAKIKAADVCYSKGYFHVEVLSCNEMIG